MSELVTDEIVEAAGRVMFPATDLTQGSRWPEKIRAALEAAAPLILARDAELHAIATQACDAETWSWDHYTHRAVDPYWIRCKALGPHDEHEDSDTGLTWKEAPRG